MNEDLKELQDDFVAEGKELLLIFQEQALSLATDKDLNALNEIFRILHNLKGTSQAVELIEFSKCVHIVEDYVQTLRSNKNLVLEREHADKLLNIHDKLLESLNKLEDGIEDKQASYEGEYLELFMNDQNMAKAIKEKKPDSEESNEDKLEVFVESKELNLEVKKEEEIKNDNAAEEKDTLVFHNVDKNKQSKEKKQSVQFVKCPIKKIDTMLNYLGETITLVNQINGDCAANLEKTRQSVTKYINELYQSCLSLTSVSVDKIRPKLLRAVNDTCVKSKKNVDFIFDGEHLEVDKFILESLSDPLVHLLRNSIDHGIETELEREVYKKSEKGIVKLSFEKSPDKLIIRIQDDGKGLDPEMIFKKAVEKGVIEATSKGLTEKEIFSLILKPGFSTNDTVSDLSGRGVGMDIVNKTVQELKGEIEIESKLGEGTTFNLSIPLNMKIYHGLITTCYKKNFILRTSDIKMIIRTSVKNLQKLKRGVFHFSYEEKLYEVVDLRQLFFSESVEQKEDGNVSVVICHLQGKSFGICVSEIVSREKLVEKSIEFEQGFLGARIDNEYFAGISVLPSGSIGAVLDIASFYNKVFHNEAA